ncbi:class I SAM-dependent methyltransferase [Lentibacter algarum]|uniref:class I SAM-dependent methyltransferase n=1 Tax=Lentibacter algarum TaxID=576131 RepID=UPI001C07CE34|nr:methyltransferase domain-containing protein [Lentibacter algarum]MBU2980964.1 class I SAM-dependent methyltransferase [Lentibacter algarum]
MHLDVKDLRNFYYRSTLGRAAQKVIRDQMLEIWPSANGQSVLGFGFAAPLLRPYLKDARRVTCLMPGPQGVMPWPAKMPNVSVLCEETHWPVETGHVDKLVLMHGLETSEWPAAVFEEAYRVLGPGGRALFIVPNRAGLWSRNDRTPFGYGRPYTLGQLDEQLKLWGFRPEHSRTALYQPPSERRFWRKTASFWEKLGRSVPFIAGGGVLMVEVTKQIPAPTRPGLGQRVKTPISILKAPPDAVPV